MKTTGTIFLGLSLTLLSSCATIVSRTKYPVRIDSSPSQANITITNRKGIEIYNGSTPANVTLKSGAGFFQKGIYSITYSKPGYLAKTITINADLNAWYFGNVVFGGVLGFLIIDPASGAMYKISDVDINETLAIDTKGNTTKVDEVKKLQIYDVNEIPEAWKKHLVKVN
jgi:hypothetical protein